MLSYCLRIIDKKTYLSLQIHNLAIALINRYIEDKDGSHICMGIVVLTEHLSEIPFFFFGEYAIKIFGHTRLIASACIVYAFRFGVYNTCTNYGTSTLIYLSYHNVSSLVDSKIQFGGSNIMKFQSFKAKINPFY